MQESRLHFIKTRGKMICLVTCHVSEMCRETLQDKLKYIIAKCTDIGIL